MVLTLLIHAFKFNLKFLDLFTLFQKHKTSLSHLIHVQCGNLSQ